MEPSVSNFLSSLTWLLVRLGLPRFLASIHLPFCPPLTIYLFNVSIYVSLLSIYLSIYLCLPGCWFGLACRVFLPRPRDGRAPRAPSGFFVGLSWTKVLYRSVAAFINGNAHLSSDTTASMPRIRTLRKIRICIKHYRRKKQNISDPKDDGFHFV